MIQPSVYSRSQIVDAAFELIREEGWSFVSTRTIAKKLGSSTMPIYSHVRSVGELEKELRIKARKLLQEFQQREYTEHVLLNLAFGYVTFARDEQYLFRFLYLESPEQLNPEDGISMKESFIREFGPDSNVAKALTAMEESGQDVLIRYTWIFTHGLAMLVNAGSFGKNSDQIILKLLMNAGEAFYSWGINNQEGVNDNE